MIQCRRRTENDGVFLITEGQKIVAQLTLTEIALKRLPEVDLSSFPWNESAAHKRIGNSQPLNMQIKDVDINVRWVNLKAKVVEKSVARRVYSRFGTSHGLSTAIISDNTGSIKLPLWDAQIEMISVGDTVEIEHARVRMFRGELQVNVGRNGKLNVIENPL